MSLPAQLARRVSRTAVGAWRQLPEAARRSTLAAASLAMDGPTLVLPRVAGVLVIAPHPDDESLGAGGTIARLADAGTRVEVVCVTRGEATIGARQPPAEIARRRSEELRTACALLGAEEPTILDLPDGRVASATDELVAILHDLTGRLQPELVLAPWALDRHPDHLAVADAVATLDRGDDCELWSYETHVPLPATRVVDITDSLERKRAGLAAHRTAAMAFDLEAMLGLNRWRSLLTNAGEGYAEAFLACRWGEVADLHARLRTASGVPGGRRG